MYCDIDVSGPGQRRGLVAGEPQRRVLGRGEMAGQWGAGALAWERHLLVADRVRSTVAAVTVSGGDLILVIRGPG
jgi:hypothetical protein